MNPLQNSTSILLFWVLLVLHAQHADAQFKFDLIEVEYQEAFGSIGPDEFKDAIETQYGEFAVVGTYASSSGRKQEAQFRILDENFALKSIRNIGSTGDDGANAIVAFGDGYLVGGYTENVSEKGDKDSWLIFLDADTEVSWSKIISSERDDEITHVALNPNKQDQAIAIASIENRPHAFVFTPGGDAFEK